MDVTIDPGTIKNVTEYEYLGVNITSDDKDP